MVLLGGQSRTIKKERKRPWKTRIIRHSTVLTGLPAGAKPADKKIGNVLAGLLARAKPEEKTNKLCDIPHVTTGLPTREKPEQKSPRHIAGFAKN